MAKNIKDFIPGFSSQSEMPGGFFSLNEATTAGGDPGKFCGPRVGSYGIHGGQFTVPSGLGISQMTIHIWGHAGNSGGMCCCGSGPPGETGPFYKATIPVTGDDKWCICQASGGCCVATMDGQQGCITWLYHTTGDNGAGNVYMQMVAGDCGCTVCNYYNNSSCQETCYTNGDGRCFNATKGLGNKSKYYCKNCVEQDGSNVTNTAFTDGLADSDVHVLRARTAWTISSCTCGTEAGYCGTQMAIPVQHNLTDKSHVLITSGYSQNGSGNETKNPFWCSMFPQQSGNSYGYGHCSWGAGSGGAVAQGGNCYCGGPAMPVGFIIHYK